MRFFSAFLFIALHLSLHAQNTPATAVKPAGPSPAKDTAIAKLFDKNAELKWVKYFKGRMDDAAVVDLALGYDGNTCKGYLTYNKSRVRYRLDGKLEGEILTLEESDPSKAVTGKLYGTLKSRRIECDWTTQNHAVGGKLVADEMPPGQTLNLNCSDEKWSSRYITRYNNARADMVLVKSQNGAIDGFLWVESDDKVYKLKGDIKADGNYELEALLPNGKTAGMIQGNLKAGQNTECNWAGSGEKRNFKFTLKDHFPLGCYEYADHQSSYDALYPRTPCQACNTWLDKQVNDWITLCKTTLSAKKEKPAPSNRNQYRAAAWPEIACWTDNVFSGYISLTDTWTEQARGLSFIFDLKAGKTASIKDLFNTSFDPGQWLKDFAAKEAPKLPAFATDPAYREWVTKEGFPMQAIRREGLEISTLFHPLYGRQTLLAPWSTLKPFMKKDNFAAEFVK